MHRLWTVRFVWLLMLATLGSAVLPLAHVHERDSEHRHPGTPQVWQQALGLAQEDPAQAPGDSEGDPCLVCAHLLSQHLASPAAPPGLTLASAHRQPVALPPAAHAPQRVAWWRPVPRAPPSPVL